MTCEEHMVSCGMGSAVCELLATRHPVPVELVGLRSFGTSAPGDVLLDHFGLDAFSIAAAARAAIARRRATGPRGDDGTVLLRDLPSSLARRA